MTVRHSDRQLLKEAKQIARDHGMFIVEKLGKYVLMRVTPTHPVTIGSRRTPDGIRRFTASCAGFH